MASANKPEQMMLHCKTNFKTISGNVHFGPVCFDYLHKIEIHDLFGSFLCM